MDKKYNFIIILFSILIIFVILYVINKSVDIQVQIGEIKYPIDFEAKYKLDECYLTVHNFISINFSSIEKNTNESGENYHTFKKEYFKTYITSFTKPYLIELMQNTSKDCLCCPV